MKGKSYLRREILLSLKPKWYDLVTSGEKIFEYRKHFPLGKTKAYIYVSSLVKEIRSIMYFGDRISLSEWETCYKNEDIRDRINRYQKNNNFAVPVEKVVDINSISLNDLRENVHGFIAPQMYYLLDNNPELRNYLHGIEEKNVIIENDFGRIDKSDICKKYF